MLSVHLEDFQNRQVLRNGTAFLTDDMQFRIWKFFMDFQQSMKRIESRKRRVHPHIKKEFSRMQAYKDRALQYNQDPTLVAEIGRYWTKQLAKIAAFCRDDGFCCKNGHKLLSALQPEIKIGSTKLNVLQTGAIFLVSALDLRYNLKRIGIGDDFSSAFAKVVRFIK